MDAPIAVLLMAYGTPRSLEEVEAYFTHIRRGRRPSSSELEDLRERYRRIGGASPLREITEAQARGLQAALDRRAPGRYRVYLAMKHAPPFVAEVTRAILDDGLLRIIAMVLAPHESRMIIDEYLEYAHPVLADRPDVRLHAVRGWHLNPRYLHAVEARIRRGLDTFPQPQNAFVVFTAHSLPERILEWDDPYPVRLEETARALATRLGLRHWRLAYQSAGHTPFRWLGPDVLEVLLQLRRGGFDQVLVVPIGFVSDHLEVLYDIDVEAQQAAGEQGLVLRRTDSLNADPEFLEGLADEVEAVR
ncbi:MAG: ferrochelatase [Armatimonadota bacterium]|nr:ferrochelatase [Armatimonadota bacterium]MDR5696374.1 ferrochelatase [Armatimonadota bacterium]